MTTIFNRQSEITKRRQLRQNMPGPELILWSRLKGKSLGGYKFRRQYGIGRYVVDFYCPQAKLVVEVDGDSHFTDESQKYDRQREEFIRSLNIKIIRFTNLDIHRSINEVLEAIRRGLES
ncbi:MAG: endonuclease domain-containing protein [Candidatus Omnitrophica bacterium]|nr:endonuclease domain-containing protein [Candidatus Omnitrophota bacterium]